MNILKSNRATAILVAAISIAIFSPTSAMAEHDMKHMGGHKHKEMDTIPDTSDKRKTPDPTQIFRDGVADMATAKGYLLNQNGEKVNMKKDYLGKVVMLTFIYTDCKYGHCPYLNNKMRYVAKKYADRMGKDLQFVSITFDPTNDTVEVLKKYSAKWDDDPSRWAFLTGSKADITQIAKDYEIVFRYNSQDKSYDHSMRTYILDRDGKVQKLFRGMEYKLQDAVTALGKVLAGQKLN